MTKFGFEYTGKNKTAFDLKSGDLITLTGYKEDVSEVEDVAPFQGKSVIVKTAAGCLMVLPGAKPMRLYK